MSYLKEKALGIGTFVAFMAMVLSAVDAYADTTPYNGSTSGGNTFSQYCPNRQYVNGQYECVQFSQDFQTNCTNAGITSWVLTIWTHPAERCHAATSHQMNIVAVCDPNSTFPELCVVEPQDGEQWCWHQTSAPTSNEIVIPTWVQDAITDAYGFTGCAPYFEVQ